MTDTKKRPHRSDLLGKLVETAAAGKTISYSALGTSRAMVGRYLSRIAHEEHQAGRPPLTAVVVHARGGGPGSGFLDAMEETGYVRPGETERQVWKRALGEVHQYWRAKLDDDPSDWPALIHLTRQTVATLDEVLGPGGGEIGEELLELATPGFALQVQLIGTVWVARAIPLRWAGGAAVVSAEARAPLEAMRGLSSMLRDAASPRG